MSESNEPVRYRCSRNHEWDVKPFHDTGNHTINITIGNQDFGPFCMRCICDWLSANTGLVREKFYEDERDRHE